MLFRAPFEPEVRNLAGGIFDFGVPVGGLTMSDIGPGRLVREAEDEERFNGQTAA